jgi:hypothetical protein
MKELYIYPLFDPENTFSTHGFEQLDTFLEHRQKLTRYKQYGKGIISGLDLEIGANHTITIKDGYGFTSHGLPIEHAETVYTHYTPYSPPPFHSSLSDLVQIDAKIAANMAIYRSKGIFKLIKAGEEDRATDTHIKRLEDISKFVVILFLEASMKKEEDGKQGSILQLKVVPMLLPRENPVFDVNLPGLYFFQRNLRFNPRKDEIQSGQDILDHFLGLISNGNLSLLQENLVRVWDFYAPLLAIQESNPFSVLHLEGLLASFKSDSRLKVMAQYLVDFIQDLTMGFTEFLEKVKSVIYANQLEPFAFPLHLNLGVAEPNKKTYFKQFRHFFQKSSISVGQPKAIEEAAFLLKRLGIMASSFYWENIEDSNRIIITPSSIGKVELSARAIPFYYDWHNLKGHWKFTGEKISFPYYHPMGYFSEHEMEANSWINRPLDYDLESFDFFRIEGHVGKDYQTAWSQLTYYQSAYSLPFQLLALNVGDLAALLQNKSPAIIGLEHKAGVTKGGTFILVFNDNKSGLSPNKKEKHDSSGKSYARLAQTLRSLVIPLGEHGEKVIAALDKKYFEMDDDSELLPDQVVIADFYLPYHLDYKQPNYPTPDKTQAPTHLHKLIIELPKRAFCETDENSYEVRIQPEGGRLLLDGEAFTSKKIVPSEIGPGEHDFTYELESDRESIKFIINRSLKPSIIIHQITYTAQNGWDVAFSTNPTAIHPLGWQLDQYQYNDDNKETEGIFRRTFDTNVGEMRVSLEVQNPPPCMYTYTYKKLIFEQKKEHLFPPLTNCTCILDRDLAVIPIVQIPGIHVEENKITIGDGREFAKGEKEIIVPVYQETNTEFVFTVVEFHF